MTTRLRDKVALVTGASRGIGKAIAIALGRQGATVLVHYHRGEAAARGVVDEIMRHDGRAFSVRADLRTLTGVDALFTAIDGRLSGMGVESRLDILVNNAAIAPQATIAETDEALFDEIFALNVKAPFFIVQKAMPRLRDGARIINLSSCVTRLAYPVEAPYAMSKGAIDVFSLLLAKELGPRGITANALAPGVIDTDMNSHILSSAEGREFAASLSVFNRVGQVDDVAQIAAFLAGPDSGWMTGHYVDATGGTLAR
jgi:NAD(P)-dependent dehydrogenase (short-subunit alcohol dehydrogenase family)